MATTKERIIAFAVGAAAVAVLGLSAWLGWPEVRLLYLFEPLGRNAQGYSEYRHRQTGIEFVRLPGGTFRMGAQKTDPNGQNYVLGADDDEAPVHEVTVGAFLIGKYEVTQAQWTVVMGSNPAGFTGDDRRPVEQVSWEDVQAFEAKTGLALPTEAQWEYACRAGKTAMFAGSGKLDDMGWYARNGGGITHPVGQKTPNEFGLRDLHGNVWELCEDVYDDRFYGKSASTGPDPVSTAGSGDRIFRGGAWDSPPRWCSSSDRSHNVPTLRRSHLGFRAAWYGWPR